MKAFPNVFLDYIPKEEYQGMDLRDYFAAKAMQSLLSSEEFMIFTNVDTAMGIVARGAYQMADAMMKAREK